MTNAEIWNNNVKGWKLSMSEKGHKNALAAMEEFAKQQGLAFAEWINKQESANGLHGKDNYGWYYEKEVVPNSSAFTHEFIGNTNDLYNLFISQQTVKP